MSSRPPLAKSAQGPAGAFGALLSAAVAQPEAVRGLAIAYAELEVEQRRKLIPAVVADAHAEGICPSLVLVPLLGVEDDREVAQQLADEIARTRAAGLAPNTMHALVAGDAERGGCLLVRPLHGTFVEVLGLAWTREAGITDSHVEPLITKAGADDCVRYLPADLIFEATPVPFAIDLVTESLWNHRQRHGKLPKDVERFADLFSASPSACAHGALCGGDTGGREPDR